jgi:hypothetical protein
MKNKIRQVIFYFFTFLHASLHGRSRDQKSSSGKIQPPYNFVLPLRIFFQVKIVMRYRLLQTEGFDTGSFNLKVLTPVPANWRFWHRLLQTEGFGTASCKLKVLAPAPANWRFWYRLLQTEGFGTGSCKLMVLNEESSQQDCFYMFSCYYSIKRGVWRWDKTEKSFYCN